MRLIDADELNEYIGRVDLDTREKIFNLVKRQPTIEVIPIDFIYGLRLKLVKLFYEEEDGENRKSYIGGITGLDTLVEEWERLKNEM